jgi:hypothetical protein
LLLPAIGAVVGFGGPALLALPVLGFLIAIGLGAALPSRVPADRGA